jgi:hypothetical protein
MNWELRVESEQDYRKSVIELPRFIKQNYQYREEKVTIEIDVQQKNQRTE